MGQPVHQMKSLWSTCSKWAYGSGNGADLLQPHAATMQSRHCRLPKPCGVRTHCSQNCREWGWPLHSACGNACSPARQLSAAHSAALDLMLQVREQE